MKYLLDVNLLLAANVRAHVHHGLANTWLISAEAVLCPIVELGFLRITTNAKAAIGLDMAQARKLLEDFVRDLKVERIDDDLPALNSQATKSDQVTDNYLADLAAKHGMKLATLDAGIKHASVELVK